MKAGQKHKGSIVKKPTKKTKPATPAPKKSAKPKAKPAPKAKTPPKPFRNDWLITASPLNELVNRNMIILPGSICNISCEKCEQNLVIPKGAASIESLPEDLKGKTPSYLCSTCTKKILVSKG